MMKLKISLLVVLFLFFHSNSIFAFRLCASDSIPKFKYDSLSLRYVDLLEDLKYEKKWRKELLDQIDDLKSKIAFHCIDLNQKNQTIDSLRKVSSTFQKKLRSNENEKIDTLLNRISKLENSKQKLESKNYYSRLENDSLKKVIESLNRDRIDISKRRYLEGKKELCDRVHRYYSENTFDELVKVSNKSNVLKDKEILLENNIDVKVLDRVLVYFDLVSRVRIITQESEVFEIINGLKELKINSEMVEKQIEYLNNYQDILHQFSESLDKLELLSREIRTTEMQIGNQKSQMIYLIFRLDYDWDVSKSNFEILKADMNKLIEDINKNPKIDVQIYRSKYQL